MKTILTFCVLIGAAIRPTRAQFEPATLIPETLHYRLSAGSAEVGSARVTIKRDPAAGVIHIVESISGLFEQTASLTLAADSSLRSLTSHVVISRHDRDQETRLQYDAGRQRIIGAVQRPAELGGARRIDAELMNGTIDFYAVPYLLRATSLWLNRTLQFPVFNALQNTKSEARVWISRIESITVPAGTFECFRVEVFSENSRVILNIDRQFPHRIIQQTFPQLKTKFELVEK